MRQFKFLSLILALFFSDFIFSMPGRRGGRGRVVRKPRARPFRHPAIKRPIVRRPIVITQPIIQPAPIVVTQPVGVMEPVEAVEPTLVVMDQDEADDLLKEAAGDCDVETMKRALEAGANPDAKSIFNRSVLHLTAKRGYVQAVQILLEYGANINARNNFGETALHLAALEGHAKCADLLLQLNPDLFIKNNCCLLYTSPSPRDQRGSRMPSSA